MLSFLNYFFWVTDALENDWRGDVAQSISMREIPLFALLPSEYKATIRQLFTSRTIDPYEVLFEVGSPVPGIYVVLSGALEVVLAGSDMAIAKISRGQSVGEMSFLDQGNQFASATIRNGFEVTHLIECKREVLEEALRQDHGLASGVFKAIANMTAIRLRETNQKISKQLEQGRVKIDAFLREMEVFAKLNQTKHSLDETGYNVVAKMNAVEEILTRLLGQLEEGPLKEELGSAISEVQGVIFGETQSIDRICQMLDQLDQYFENLKRVVQGGSPVKVRGDQNLFKKEAS